MSNRERVYQYFKVNNDRDAFDACDEFILMKTEGSLIAAIQEDNRLRVIFTPFSWSKFTHIDLIADNRYEALFALMCALMDQKGWRK